MQRCTNDIYIPLQYKCTVLVLFLAHKSTLWDLKRHLSQNVYQKERIIREDVMKRNVTLALPSADVSALVTPTTNAIFRTDHFHD